MIEDKEKIISQVKEKALEEMVASLKGEVDALNRQNAQLLAENEILRVENESLDEFRKKKEFYEVEMEDMKNIVRRKDEAINEINLLRNDLIDLRK